VGQATQELKGMISKRDVENARLRDQREQQAAELNERKHKENVKLASLQELKALAESRSASDLNLHNTAAIDVQKIGTHLGVGVGTSSTQGSTCSQYRQRRSDAVFC
jgi:E3 ubiquitin-protein ligase BRE1